jgi:DNA polymerase I-like protein with 3'-5' exonuclease and polymerase domains
MVDIPTTVLVDARNIQEHMASLCGAIASSDFIGIDCETQDDARHDGLNIRCGYDPVTRKKPQGTRLILDHKRTTLCGVSLYSEQMPHAYYLNIGHADVENRLPKEALVKILDCKPAGSHWVAHNASFELTTFAETLGYELAPIICTLQMCVSAYGPHEFGREAWLKVGQGGIARLVPDLMLKSMTDLDPLTMEMTPELSTLVYKIIAKESDAEHSYNGLVDSVAYGYSLKQAVFRWFGYQMRTFQETLGDAAHMGQLTGEQVAAYGGDDAIWAIQLFRHLLDYMAKTGGQPLLDCFFRQEAPMAKVFSSIARGGLRVNTGAIVSRRQSEREEAANILRGLKLAVRDALPFPATLNDRLLKYEKWYQKNGQRYRDAISAWAYSADSNDPYDQCYQVAGAVSNAWAEEKGARKPTGPNFSHYMPVRVLLYDLIGAPLIVSQGKVESDKDARGKVKDSLSDTTHTQILDSLNALAGVEQRMKLYLTPYNQLMDPDSGCLYPTVTSMLATRRMASSEPNGMQLAKRGESTYVRGFFKPDYDDHVIVSIDWSAIELVEIGEFSGDPEFIQAFGQKPHEDLHSGASADVLSVAVPGLTEPLFKSLKRTASWDEWLENYGSQVENVARLRTNLRGDAFAEPKDAYKFWRTEVGKGANFNYWYSGYLATIGERMGWSSEQTSQATQAYASRFAVAEQWRLELIDEVRRNGYITLPDGHRYSRFEATEQWAADWAAKFCAAGEDMRNYNLLVNWLAKKISRRGGNQAVNAYIQGTCATIAKRSIIGVNDWLTASKYGWREARFMMPVHDELVWSVHKDLAPEFIDSAYRIMTTHPDIFQKCQLDAAPAIGLTFEPFDITKAPIGQIELAELPKEVVGFDLAGKRADAKITQTVINYLFAEAA